MEKIRFKNWIPPKIEHNKLTLWNWMCSHPENLILGRNTDIGAFCYLQAEEGIVIEDNVQIAAGCKIYSVSTIDDKRGKVILKKGAKIGANSVIMPNVTIGENSIIGAFGFVNKDVPDNVVAIGIPTKLIRRLSKEEIEGLREEKTL